jgi:hypothetical protein
MKRNQKILAILTSLIAASAMLWAQAGPNASASPMPSEYNDAQPLHVNLAQQGGGTPLAVRFFPPER